jgi:putative endonuclease
VPSLFARLAARLRGRTTCSPEPQAQPDDASDRGRSPVRQTATARQGLWGEREAEKWLVREAGLKCIGRRVKVGRDEIDLVMENRDAHGREIVFVEVKTRSSELFGGGRAAMDRRKRNALCRAVSRYMRRLPPTPFRIDLVEVYGRADSGEAPRVEHQRAAVPMNLRYTAPALARRH